MKQTEGIVRDKKGNLREVNCVVCGVTVTVTGGLIKHLPYCGKHYREKATIKPSSIHGVVNGKVVR